MVKVLPELVELRDHKLILKDLLDVGIAMSELVKFVECDWTLVRLCFEHRNQIAQ
jgi:hypothetical protein